MIDYAWISKLLCDVAFTWLTRELWCWLKKWLISGNLAIWTVLVSEKSTVLTFIFIIFCYIESGIFLRFERRFFKAPFLWRISVDGRPNCRNKTGFLNISGVVLTGPKFEKTMFIKMWNIHSFLEDRKCSFLWRSVQSEKIFFSQTEYLILHF